MGRHLRRRGRPRPARPGRPAGLAAAPETPSDVLDLGCGTGSLSVLAAADGHRVADIDLSPTMVDRARDKTVGLGLDATFAVGDAGGAGLPRSGGVSADTLRDAVAPLVDTIVVHDLAADADLWGRDVADERYAPVADMAPRQYS